MTTTQVQRVETLKGRVAICLVILRKEADAQRRAVAQARLSEYQIALAAAQNA